MAADWYSDKIARLSEIKDDETKIEILRDMKIKLKNTTRRQLEEISGNLHLTQLFKQLTTKNRVYVEEICSVLRTIEDSLEPGKIYERYPAEFRELLSHEDASVRREMLHQISRIARDPGKIELLRNDEDLLTATIEKIGDDDLGVANMTMEVAKTLGSDEKGANKLFSGVGLRTVARLVSQNDTTSFRIYECVVGIAVSTKYGFEAAACSGFLNSLIKTLDHQDILIQLNGIQVLTEVALSDEGLNYLEERHVLEKLANKIARASEEPLSNLLIPGLMQFFGRVAKSRPREIFSKYPAVVSALFQVIDGDDTSVLGNALDTLGYVASSPEGKYALESLGDAAMPRAMKNISEIVQKAPSEMRLRALENLALIVGVEADKRDNRIISLTKSWFDCLADDPLAIIVNICKLPFPDLRQAALELIATISTQNWAQERIANFPGLVEFLLDRSVEAFKNCKDRKYRIVKTLAEVGTDVFDANTAQRLKKYVNEGPFHVDPEAEISTEGAS